MRKSHRRKTKREERGVGERRRERERQAQSAGAHLSLWAAPQCAPWGVTTDATQCCHGDLRTASSCVNPWTRNSVAHSASFLTVELGGHGSGPQSLVTALTSLSSLATSQVSQAPPLVKTWQALSATLGFQKPKPWESPAGTLSAVDLPARAGRLLHRRTLEVQMPLRSKRNSAKGEPDPLL